MKKRYRAPKTKDGELKIYYGKLPHNSPDIIYSRGNGVPRCDSSLLHLVLGSQRHNVIDDSWDISLFDELEKRGYDIETIKFSIMKKDIPNEDKP
jgi:hypothetical protein